ncbi:hypothetical protein EZV73_07425 [Acidaminobacter sp. JC074]|uniref:hypothetical protein n=1 Tax=Acidaminobacter sp. JC074 TaxID=2530199 RepID=UPI001F0EF121|nr:hypothetical protein [Acidaminobacter sp. JC074]MCH4887395.1 hypothetical protein [Acidaminobacter sp. JC074]
MKTNRLIQLLTIVLILSSCDSNLDLSTGNNLVEVDTSISENIENLEVPKALNDKTSWFEEFENIEAISFLDNIDSSIYDTMIFESKDTDYNNRVINTYLIERGVQPSKPEGEINRGDLTLGQYYLDGLGNKIIIILRVWNLELEPEEVYIACITFDLDQVKEKSFIQYDYNKNNQLIKEILYSEDGDALADIEYMRSRQFPFSIIKTFKSYNNDYNHVSEILNRNEKFWFYKERMHQSEDGRPIDYVGDVFYINQNEAFEANKDQLTFYYNQQNQLESIRGSLVNKDFYKDKNEKETYDSMAKIDLNYSSSGYIDYIKYSLPALIYGSYDSMGEIFCDDTGRMIYNSYYVTHGSVEEFYFYKESEDKPFICLMFDSMPITGEDKDGLTYMYGNYSEMYMFDNMDE